MQKDIFIKIRKFEHDLDSILEDMCSLVSEVEASLEIVPEELVSDEQAESIVAIIDDLKESISYLDEAIDWLPSEGEPV